VTDGLSSPLRADRAPGDGAADARRVSAIGDYGVLARPPGRDLQALVELAAQVCQVPTAAINLIGDHEQHQLATVGFERGICAREDSMCNAVLHTSGPVIVPDARVDERFADNPSSPARSAWSGSTPPAGWSRPPGSPSAPCASSTPSRAR
jgi:hypothetical protein